MMSNFPRALFPLSAIVLAAIGLAIAASAETPVPRPGPTRGALELSSQKVPPLPESSIGQPAALRLDPRSGFAYSRELQVGSQHFEFRARGPLPRTAARRRFLGMQLELRF